MVYDIYIKGEIIDDKSLSMLKGQLPEGVGSGDVVNFYSDSIGGDVSEGIDIFYWIKDLRAKGAYVNWMKNDAMSIASIMGLSANKRYITRTGEEMIHDPLISTDSCYNAKDLREHADMLDNIKDVLIHVYADNGVKLNRETLDALMFKETRFNADQSVKYGFSNGIIPEFNIPEKYTIVNSNIKHKKMSIYNYGKRFAKALGIKIKNVSFNTLDGREVEVFIDEGQPITMETPTDATDTTFALDDGKTYTTDEQGYIVEIVDTPVENDPPMEVVNGDNNMGTPPEDPIVTNEGDHDKFVSKEMFEETMEEVKNMIKNIAQGQTEVVNRFESSTEDKEKENEALRAKIEEMKQTINANEKQINLANKQLSTQEATRVTHPVDRESNSLVKQARKKYNKRK